MTVGLQVYNDWGSVLLSSNRKNLAVTQSGSFATVSKGSLWQFAGSAYLLTVPANSQKPMLAFAVRGGNQANYLGGGVVNGSATWKFNVQGPPGTIVDYWVFDVPPGAPVGPGYGIEVYDAVGSLCYAIQNKPLRIRDVIHNADNYDFYYESGRTYAAIMGTFGNNMSWESGFAPGPRQQVQFDCYGRVWSCYSFGVTGNNVQIGQINHSKDEYGTFDPDFGAAYTTTPNIIIVDVTNL